MATTNFTVSVYTPSRVLAENVPAESLLVPTVRGQINLLKDHTHIVSRLETGSLTVFGGADDGDRHFAVSCGVCKVLEDKVVILANTAEQCFEIDEERAQASLQNAERVLNESDGLDDDAILKYQRKVERAKLRIQLARDSKNRKK